MLVLVGVGDLAKDGTLTAEQVRRAAGVAARNVGNAASVAIALPAADADQVRAVADGFLTRRLHASTAASRARGSKPVSEVAILSEAARQQASIEALATAQRSWPGTPTPPGTG